MIDSRNGEMVVTWEMNCNHRQTVWISLSEFMFLVANTKSEADFRAKLWNAVKLSNEGWSEKKAIPAVAAKGGSVKE